ncbi:MAG: thiamine pyrophosphate-binding protein [Candidatus Omnitrophota bacterium]
MGASQTGTVGQYLAARLYQAGLKHIFGVPGDYVLSFFDCLEESGMRVICTCNELNAGYAADAYARENGAGGVCVTYGVGGFSLFNAVVGSHAERLPVIVVSGGPKLSERSDHHLLHHTIGDMNLQYRIYQEITIASVILTNPQQAPRQIDETITACLRYKRPVYIEIPTDLVNKPCRKAGPFEIDTTIYSDRPALGEAVEEAADILRKAEDPVILAGVEAHRLGARRELQELVDKSGYPFVVTLLGKSVIPEQHPQFAGIYGGAASRKSAWDLAHGADVILSLGALMTDIQIGKDRTLLELSRMISANSDNVRIKHHVYNHVSLKDFIIALKDALPAGTADPAKFRHPSEDMKTEFIPEAGKKITARRFYQRINRFIDKNTTIIADTGDALFSAANLFLPEGCMFIDQAFYLSIGYSVPAALGAKLASPGRRPVVFVGDGAFQMTAQELSTIIRHRLNPVFFLLNNQGYTVERVIHDGPYNDIFTWKYHKFPELFDSGWGFEVRTEDDLEKALEKAEKNNGETAFIEVHLDKWDCSENLKKLARDIK